MDVWECALAFTNSQMLLTAEEIGVFNALERGSLTAAELATEVGLPEDSAERLLTGLCALGIVETTGGRRYANSPEASEKLVRGKPGYIGDLFLHVREDLYPVWRYFREALEEGRSQWHRAFPEQNSPTREMYSDPAALRAFMDGMHAISYDAGAELAASAPELEKVSHIVDIGGASGAFLIALAKHFPHLRGTVVDLPQVEPVTQDHVRANGLDGRIGFHPADFFNDPLPNGADAYSLGFILHDWSTEEGSRLLSRVADVCPRDGLLIVGEYLLDDDKTGPLFVARSDLNMLVAARGRERTAAEYTAWLREFGFRVQRIQPTWKDKHFLLARRV